ncbi:hypothetical protein SARC_08617 [Sphaeroforma arctica JP610]|uniref:Pumilio domain-containing protein NOP9 n=1 Tax=Sphaeroforma arctica JP610 TaxID=667725 RepID=A0A0L0FQZ9_9EUKA|nr:hypothetical protein SARC_08617 [Sphaeroforma arctica JP610]KNC78971.1 hypothetical protein SARC_08617 [Sphaeroforma arctica JP610]|eukprot:XP_014152873.1 hypothetical protein SARC_08617 [Sphaeroforma arctica JP610]
MVHAEADSGAGKHAYSNKKKKEKKRQKEKDAGIKVERTSQFVDGATLDYWRQVGSTLDADEFPDAEDKSMFVSNVLTVADGSETQLCRDKEISCILEKLLLNCTHFQIRVFTDRLMGHVKDLAGDKFASHVIQTLLNLLPGVLHAELSGASTEGDESERDGTSETEGHLRTGEELVLAICDELKADITYLSRGDYGSHVIRALVGLMVGGGVPNELMRSQYSIAFSKFQKTETHTMEKVFAVPGSFEPAMHALIQPVCENKYLTKDATHTTASGVLQVLLAALHRTDAAMCETLILRLLGNGSDVETDENGEMIESEEKDVDDFEVDMDRVTKFLIYDQIGSHVMERILSCASAKLGYKLYRTLFRGRLDNLGKHPVANYVVQNMIRENKDPVVTSLILTELQDQFESVIASGCVGVVVRLVEAVAKLEDKKLHKAVFSHVMKAFHMNDTAQQKQCVNLITTLTTHDAYFEEGKDMSELPLQLNGVLLIQALFTLKPPHNDLPAASLLDLPAEQLLSLCMQSLGRPVDTFLECTVDVGKKNKLMKLLKGSYAKLAMDKYGSRVVDACWAVADLKLKDVLAAELIKSEVALKKDFYGRVIWRNCRLDHFKRKRDAWVSKVIANERKKGMFSDILDDDTAKEGTEPSGKNSKSIKRSHDESNNEKETVNVDLSTEMDMDDIFGETEKSKKANKKRKGKANEKKAAERAKANASATVDVVNEAVVSNGESGKGLESVGVKSESMDSDLLGVLDAIKGSKGKKSSKAKKEKKAGDKTKSVKSKFTMN